MSNIANNLLKSNKKWLLFTFLFVLREICSLKRALTNFYNILLLLLSLYLFLDSEVLTILLIYKQ